MNWVGPFKGPVVGDDAVGSSSKRFTSDTIKDDDSL